MVGVAGLHYPKETIRTSGAPHSLSLVSRVFERGRRLRWVTHDLSITSHPVFDIDSDDYGHCVTIFPRWVEVPVLRCSFEFLVSLFVEAAKHSSAAYITFVTDYGQ